jgi:hypothetical protein
MLRFLLAVAVVVTLGACRTDRPAGTGAAAGPRSAATTTDPVERPASSAPAGRLLPDVCTLLTRAEVTRLTDGKPILSIDPDGLTEAATVRYCQWQLSGARIAVQLAPTTATTFGQDRAGSEPVAGLGDDAHFFANHLFVRKETIQVDVYASTAEGVTNDKRVARSAAAMVVARL